MKKIGKVELRNEFIMAPVKTGYGKSNGEVTQAHLAWYDRHSKHVGAIILEPFYLDSKIREIPTQISIASDSDIENLKKLADVVHSNGSKAIVHLNHAGRLANPKMPDNIYVSSSDVVCPSYGTHPKPLTKEEIKGIVKLYGDAAVRAEKANYDAIELQFGHGYLIAQFLSPSVNKREDEYGGSFENRVRFGLEIVEELKERTSLPIIIRISGSEMIEGGWSIDDTLKLIKLLDEKGVAAFHVSAGTLCQTPAWYYQHMFVPKKKTWEFAKEVKENTSLPVIAVGKITSFEDIEEIKKSNSADFIALGRALVADPDFVGKYLKEIAGPVRPCLGCLDGCVFGVKGGKGIMCVSNPEVKIIDLAPVEKAEKVKNFAVVGAGLTGMQAALTLKERGHNVTIFEKGDIGGQFNLAHLPPHKESLQKLISYLTEMTKDMITKKEVKAEDLIGKYDEVILATGSSPIAPPFPCTMEYRWADILTETNISNKNIVIVGGGMIGIETAHWLAEKNNNVTVIEMLSDVARDMNAITKKLTLTAIEKSGKVKIMTDTMVTKAENGIVYYKKGDIEGKIENVDILVVTIGLRSNRAFADELEGKITYHLLGDAHKVGTALSNLQHAYDMCKHL